MTSHPASPTVAPAEGKLGILNVGLGAVTTTLIAGVELAKRGLGQPVGSLTQMGTIRLGKRTDDNVPLVKDFVPLAELDDIVFGAWDPYRDNAYDAAVRAGVLEARHLDPIADALRAIEPMPAAFDAKYVKRLEAENVMADTSKRGMLEQIRADIRAFREQHGCARLVMIWSGSTEVYIEPGPAHASIEAFEAAIDAEDDSIAPSMLYAYAALLEGVPYANGAPNLAVDTSALRTFAEEQGVAISGKDYKTGQTLLKTVLAPMLKARMLGLNGWYSTNILGNRDGEVLDDPENFKTKETSKLGVLEDVLEPERFPELYGDVYHKVRINYYPPRGDAKEGWDNIDLFGWLGYPMQMKVDFLCRDSILAAPLALDLCLFMDLAQRAGMGGIQEWLSFYFKSPQVAPGLYPEHDLFIQLTKLKNTLRWMMGEDVITHLGQDYAEEELAGVA
ncbi:inositol-3-phosphate synthase [Conexibacter sp. SYSU D00693]|uniref:inositol-3-phosphate synthase n=1 Tax=Conexibacter sp. SYSU D00693 TaxID=2812560 RepID=UPI00196A46A7|nr:inositol-3-phosphate synthase [Conexibacter sp. SYSU D00693]